jgi:osmotically-inducible protein OsmY
MPVSADYRRARNHWAAYAFAYQHRQTEVGTVTRVHKLVGSANWGRRAGDLLIARARAALDLAFGEAAAQITVRVQSGVVVLRGEVEDMRDISRFEAAVRHVPGVVDVDNLLRLRLTGRAARPTVLSA